jgi:hypothetical protein
VLPSPTARVQAKRRVRADIEYENDPYTARILAMPQNEQQALFRACRYQDWHAQRKWQVTAATLKAQAQRTVVLPFKARLRPGCPICVDQLRGRDGNAPQRDA